MLARAADREERAARRQDWVVRVAVLLGEAHGALAGRGKDVRVLRRSIVQGIRAAAMLEQSLALRRTHLKRRIDRLTLACAAPGAAVRSELDQSPAAAASPGTGDDGMTQKTSISDQQGADLTPK